MILKVLDLSTNHIPPHPTFGGIRASEHEHGYVLFVNPTAEAPDWLEPIHDLAIKEGCLLINFDCDGEVYEQFKVEF